MMLSRQLISVNQQFWSVKLCYPPRGDLREPGRLWRPEQKYSEKSSWRRWECEKGAQRTGKMRLGELSFQ